MELERVMVELKQKWPSPRLIVCIVCARDLERHSKGRIGYGVGNEHYGRSYSISVGSNCYKMSVPTSCNGVRLSV